jgi:hypothetical protein
MLCSPEDADSIWFWQCLEQFDWALTNWRAKPSEEFMRDMLNRYMPECHGSKTPLQLAAVATAYHLANKKSDRIQYLEGIVAAIVATGVGLHEGDHYLTPLLLFLSTFSGSRYRAIGGLRPRDIQSGLRVWLKILHDTGTDLVSYGFEEAHRYLAYRALEDPTPPLEYWSGANHWVFPVSDDMFCFTFTYGPTLEDWTVELDRMVEQYVGNFWQMPGLLNEYGIRAMPGGWIEDV